MKPERPWAAAERHPDWEIARGTRATVESLTSPPAFRSRLLALAIALSLALWVVAGAAIWAALR